MSSHPHRRAAAALVGLAVSGGLVIACTKPRPGRFPTTVPETTVPDTTIPDTTGTTATTRPGSGPIDCGTIYYASGWPTTMVVNIEIVGACFLDAWETGTRAKLVTREQTDGQGGHILIKTYEVRGPGELRVRTDPTQTVTPGPVRIETCSTLTHNLTHLIPGDCLPVHEH
jgi:hypothetical protein